MAANQESMTKKRIQLDLLDTSPTAVMPWKAVVLWQPWASLLFTLCADCSDGIRAVKQHETRPFTTSWAKHYQGNLFIQAASRKMDDQSWGVVHRLYEAGQLSHLPTREDFPLGCLVGLVHVDRSVVMHQALIDSQPSSELMTGDWQINRLAILIDRRWKMEQTIPIKGGQGLYCIPETIRQQIVMQMGQFWLTTPGKS